jgi:spore germination protein YaaH/serine protease inhibitor ecotin
MYHRPSVAPLRFGLAIVIAISAIQLVAPVAAAASPAAAETAPSIQYREALEHESKKYNFAPGGPVTVGYVPRAGDTYLVDGAGPVSLPAANGTAAKNATRGAASPSLASMTMLRREVYGFLPYWELGSTLDYSTLSTIAYFGVGLNVNLSNPSDPAIGTIAKSGNGWNGWNGSTMTTVINSAHAAGARVALTIESFAWDSAGAANQSQILGTDTVRLRTAAAIVAEVVRRGADGVNLDFEPIASGQIANYVTFVQELRTALDAAHPGYELVFCATGSPGTYDLTNLTADGAADAVFIMGYNFRGGTPSTTGSIDPITSPYVGYTLTGVVRNYKAKVPASKIIVGLPWYGEAWSTGGPQSCAACQAVNAPPARTQAELASWGQPAEAPYSTAAALAAQTDSTHIGLQYDTVEQTAWTAYFGTFGGGTSASWRQFYFDNYRSESARIDSIDGWDLRGMGIWALGYDTNNGNGDLTKAVADKLEVPVSGSSYVPLAPTRILDTRNGTGGLSGGFTSGVPRTFQVTGTALSGVPAGATAVTGVLTVTRSTGAGYLYVGPRAVASPSSSTLNFPAGDDRANTVSVMLGDTGSLAITYVSTTRNATAQVVFDITGYYPATAAPVAPATAATASTYTPVAPTRILDTRNGTGGLSGTFTSAVPRTFQVTGTTLSGVPAGATAITGILTATQATGGGYLYAGPAEVASPTSSTLNFPAWDDRANSVSVMLSGSGALSITYMSSARNATAHVVFDITGYYTPDTTGATYVPITPTRILDTRSGTGLAGASGSGVPRTFQVSGTNLSGVPYGASAVTGILTVTLANGRGFLYIGPIEVASPVTSTVNFPAWDNRANSVFVQLGPTGTLSVTYVSSVKGATAHIVFDVTGYYVP